MPGERGHYKRAPRGPPTLWVVACGGLTVSTPPTNTEGPSLCHNLPLRCPSISLTGAPGTRRQKWRSEVCVLRSQECQGEVGVLSVHRGSPSQNRGDLKRA